MRIKKTEKKELQ